MQQMAGLGAQFCTSPQARPMLRLFKREFFAIFDDWILSIRRVCLCKDDALRNAVEGAAIPGPGIVGNGEIVLIGFWAAAWVVCAEWDQEKTYIIDFFAFRDSAIRNLFHA